MSILLHLRLKGYAYTRFFPAATAKEALVFGPEEFSGTPEVRFFDKNPALSEDAAEIGTMEQQTGYFGQSSVSFRLRALAPSGSGLDPRATENGSVLVNGVHELLAK